MTVSQTDHLTDRLISALARAVLKMTKNILVHNVIDPVGLNVHSSPSVDFN